MTPAGGSAAQQRSVDDGRPIVYWRPGCRYCLRLRVRVGWAGQRAHWVNILRKLDTTTRAQAATIAERAGLLDAGQTDTPLAHT